MPNTSRTKRPRPSPDDAVRAMDALRRVVSALRSSSRTAVAERGVTGAQLFVLQQLDATPNQSVSDLAVRTSTRQNSASEVVARLVRRGLVTRAASAEDGRRAVVSLTSAGRAVVRRAPPVAQGTLVDALLRLSARQRRALAEGLERWVTEASLSSVPATMFFEPPPTRKTPSLASGRRRGAR